MSKPECTPAMPDLEVIHTYKAHQAASCFRLLYDRYASKIYSKCLTLLRDPALAEDATQEIFTKIFMNLARFGEKSKFSTWVYSITYNFCIDYIRRRKKQQAVFSDEIENAPDVVADDHLDEELLQMEVTQLKKVLEELSVNDSSILLMKYQDDMSIREIAESLDKTESAIKMQLKRAKEKARRLRTELFPEPTY